MNLGKSHNFQELQVFFFSSSSFLNLQERVDNNTVEITFRAQEAAPAWGATSAKQTLDNFCVPIILAEQVL